MANLLRETKAVIKRSGHTPDDIVFIGSKESGHACTWGEFCQIADQEYKSGLGTAQVARDLIIVFSDGHQMWRGEYDGAEWWNNSEPFIRPKKTKTIKHVFAPDGAGQECLCDINPN